LRSANKLFYHSEQDQEFMLIRYVIPFMTALMVSLLGFVSWLFPIQSASEPTSLNNVTLWIYPEYDDPRVLTMIEGRITGVSAPTQIRFLVPKNAEMYSAGSKDAQGNYSGGPPDRKASQLPGWDEISYTLKTEIFRVEYYDPIINGQLNKSISYDFKTLYLINDLKVVVQVPLKATDFSVLPAGIKSSEGNFSVFNYSLTNLTIDKPVHFDISYTKSDPNPSLGTSSPTASQGGSNNLLAILIGVLIIAITFVWALKSTKKKSPVKSRTPQSNRVKVPSKFCNQCGKKLEYPSKYCPYCKHRLDS
jgi:hypothetical protein